MAITSSVLDKNGGRSKQAIADLWKRLLADPALYDLLDTIKARTGKYRFDSHESEHPHIQSERNGGVKAIETFCSQLLTGYDEFIEEVEEEAKLKTKSRLSY